MSEAHIKQTIVDTAVIMAEEKGWENVRLFDVAVQLNIPVGEIAHYFKDKDEIADEWFNRANVAMMQRFDTNLLTLSMPDRYFLLISTWLDAISTHPRATRGMIWSKLEPGHIHIQLLSIFRISRTVQWLREVSHCQQAFVKRAMHETWLTYVFLSTVAYWMYDRSPAFEKTKLFLRRRLLRGERLHAVVRDYVKFPVRHWLDSLRNHFHPNLD